MIDFDKILNNREVEELEDEEVEILDLGEFTDSEVEDSIVTSWNQLFNELVDEGESRIDRRFGEVRGKKDISNNAMSVIKDYVQRIQESLSNNINRVEKYLSSFVKRNYALQDSLEVEENE